MMEEVQSYYDSSRALRDVYRGRPPPRTEERQTDAREYTERRSRSPGSPNRSLDSEQRVPSPKRVTWKDPVEQQKSQNNVSRDMTKQGCSSK